MKEDVMVWFHYDRGMPYLSCRLHFSGRRTTEHRWLVDSGAYRSIAPQYLLSSLMDASEQKEPVDIREIADVHGRPLRGQLHTVEFEIKDLGRITEEVAFCRDVKLFLLGQNTFFRQYGVLFAAWPAISGRKRGDFKVFRAR